MTNEIEWTDKQRLLAIKQVVDNMPRMPQIVLFEILCEWPASKLNVNDNLDQLGLEGVKLNVIAKL